MPPAAFRAEPLHDDHCGAGSPRRDDAAGSRVDRSLGPGRMLRRALHLPVVPPPAARTQPKTTRHCTASDSLHAGLRELRCQRASGSTTHSRRVAAAGGFARGAGRGRIVRRQGMRARRWQGGTGHTATRLGPVVRSTPPPTRPRCPRRGGTECVRRPRREAPRRVQGVRRREAPRRVQGVRRWEAPRLPDSEAAEEEGTRGASGLDATGTTEYQY